MDEQLALRFAAMGVALVALIVAAVIMRGLAHRQSDDRVQNMFNSLIIGAAGIIALFVAYELATDLYFWSS